jgi:hypothetical protein
MTSLIRTEAIKLDNAHENNDDGRGGGTAAISTGGKSAGGSGSNDYVLKSLFKGTSMHSTVSHDTALQQG